MAEKHNMWHQKTVWEVGSLGIHRRIVGQLPVNLIAWSTALKTSQERCVTVREGLLGLKSILSRCLHLVDCYMLQFYNIKSSWKQTQTKCFKVKLISYWRHQWQHFLTIILYKLRGWESLRKLYNQYKWENCLHTCTK